MRMRRVRAWDDKDNNNDTTIKNSQGHWQRHYGMMAQLHHVMMATATTAAAIATAAGTAATPTGATPTGATPTGATGAKQ